MRFPFGPKLLHLFGPIWINFYGVIIAIGLLVFLWLSARDPRRKRIITFNDYLELLSIGIISGIFFARLFYALGEFEYFYNNPIRFFHVWDGGLSFLGALIGIPIILLYQLRKRRIPIIRFFDLVTTYIPLLNAISRIGCFIAGCCHGCIATSINSFLTITYTHQESLAPLNMPLYPTQLYSSMISACIFINMYVLSKQTIPNGLITLMFFTLEGLSRFTMDFWRGDRNNLIFSGISWYQTLALFIAIFGLIGTLYILLQKSRHPK